LTRRDRLTQFRSDVLTGLSQSPKQIPSKYFYDAPGSALFDRICELPEYYLTRTEISIMGRHASAIAAAAGPGCLVVEFGNGSSVKTPILLEALSQPVGYIPVDISREHLRASARMIEKRFPKIEVSPVWADFTEAFQLPPRSEHAQRTLVYFPGSTIGNFTPREATALLARIADLAGPGGALLIGVDTRKPREIIEPAYNDGAGVTAEFNLNLLARINRELKGQFDLASFEHRAFFDEIQSRIEMHLISRTKQTVLIDDVAIAFKKGESIRTEYSYKYRPEYFAKLASQAHFQMQQVWMDDEQLFSVQLLTATAAP
jgi:dimethylhistidine N-methyltransferase